MDANRFDDWARKRAARLSRRDAIRLAGAGGAAVAVPVITRHALAQSTCSLTIHAEIAAGPSASETYDGTLQFALGSNGTFTQVSFTPPSGGSQPATGQATGRAIDVQITLSGNQVITLTGVAGSPISTCPTAVAGILSGPQAGDLGAWQATAALPPTVPATSNQGATDSTTTCPAGQTVCGTACVEISTDPENCGGCGIVCASGACAAGVCVAVQACTPDGGGCTVPADCCSGLCPHESNAPGICGCSQIGGVCAGSDDCCQQGGGTLVACLGGTNSDRCIVLNGGACTSDSDCLGQSCVNGMCGSACQADGAPCQSSTDCCAGVCSNGVCGCASLGQSCSDAFMCCDGSPVVCLGACCIINGFACSADADCCDYFQGNGFCTNGLCTRAS